MELAAFDSPYKIHLGPGPNWTKPDKHWVDVDIDPKRGDVVVDFGQFSSFPIADKSVSCIYGSHVFEHMSIYTSQTVFEECHRVLQPGGILRLILPDVEKSIREYVSANSDFEIFKRRAERAKKQWGVLEYTLFDSLREDFLSRSGQPILGKQALAHQNAWEFETIKKEIDEIKLVYTEFKSTLSYEPKLLQLLPAKFESTDKQEKNEKEEDYSEVMRFEPSAEEVLNYLIPKYINDVIYGAMIESSASEQGARRVAMDNASDNAEEMIDTLQLLYNRARQATITQEISEIVGGSEALG
jgi:SAM-dependent methyltransferase